MNYNMRNDAIRWQISIFIKVVASILHRLLSFEISTFRAKKNHNVKNNNLQFLTYFFMTDQRNLINA